MNWSDERYVRFYTRNTPEWLALSWQARGLFGLLLREVDRAGVLKLGRVGKRGVGVIVQAPWSEVEGPLDELLVDGCLEINGEYLLVRNFQTAQEAVQSDRLRQAKSREQRRAQASVPTEQGYMPASVAQASVLSEQGHTPSTVTIRDDLSRFVTESHARSQPVTRGHAASHDVTPSVPSDPIRAVPSDPCCAVPSSSPSERVGEPAAPAATAPPLTLVPTGPARNGKAPKPPRRHPEKGPDGPITHDRVRAVIAHLADRSGVSQAVQPPSAEWWMVVDRLGERPAAELCQAIDLACADQFRRKQGRTSLRSILATPSAVTEALALGAPGGGARATTRQERERAVFSEAIEEARRAEAAAAMPIDATDVRRSEP